MPRQRRIFIPILLTLPVALFFLNRNWPFQSFGDYDAFFYFGHFLHFPHYQKLSPGYSGERLPWILPGYALVHLLGPIPGELVLHFLVWYVSVFSLYSIVTRFTTPQTGFLTAFAFGIHPYFLAAAGMDYIIGPSLAYMLLSFALLIRPAPLSTACAGAAWAAAIYCYPLCLLFTPASIPIYIAARTRARLVRSALLFTSGAIILTAILALLYHHIFGDGFNFQRITIGTTRALSHLRQSPWAPGNFSVTYADWLVFPGVAAALAVWLLIRGRGIDRYLALSYLYCAAVMLILTIRPTRSLEFDYFASFLLPGAFLVLGLAFFQIEDRSTTPSFWLILAASTAIALAPLAHPGLYVKPPILGAVAPALFLIAAAAIRSICSSLLIAAPLFAAASFCLAPAVGGIAWRDPRDWMAATSRVAQAVKLIESRLPYDQYPAFEFPPTGPDTLEYQAIMCAFLSHAISNQDHYPPGQIVVILSSTPLANPPRQLLWQQSVDSIQITATR